MSNIIYSMELLFIDYTLLKKERLETYHNIYYVNFYDLKYISIMDRYENRIGSETTLF